MAENYIPEKAQEKLNRNTIIPGISFPGTLKTAYIKALDAHQGPCKQDWGAKQEDFPLGNCGNVILLENLQ